MNPLESIEVHEYKDKIANEIIINNDLVWTTEFFEYCRLFNIKITTVASEDDIYQVFICVKITWRYINAPGVKSLTIHAQLQLKTR